MKEGQEWLKVLYGQRIHKDCVVLIVAAVPLCVDVTWPENSICHSTKSLFFLFLFFAIQIATKKLCIRNVQHFGVKGVQVHRIKWCSIIILVLLSSVKL